MQVGDVLQFLSGAARLPSTGFETNPKIRFCDEDCLPRVSTCDISITFSRKMGQLSYNQFKQRMDMCIRECFGFGSV